MAKTNIIADLVKGQFRVETVNKDGQVTRTEMYSAVESMPQDKTIAAVMGYVKDVPSKNRACVNLIGYIIRHNLGNAGTLKQYMGKCDRSQALPAGLRDVFLKAEEQYFDQFMDEKNKDHAGFVKMLPKESDRGNPLTLNGVLNRSEQYHYFLRTLRKDSAYGTQKATCMGFLGYLGLPPYNEDGSLIPADVMRAYINEVRDIKGPDRSLKARLQEILADVTSGAATKDVQDMDWPAIVRVVDLLHEQVKAMNDAAAARITARGGPVNVGQPMPSVPTQAADAIKQAQAPADTGKAKPAKKEEEPAEHASASGTKRTRKPASKRKAHA